MNQPRLLLKQFLDQRELSIRAFALANGILPSIVHRVCHGHDTGGKNWARIMVGTEGLVTPLSHYPLARPARARRKR